MLNVQLWYVLPFSVSGPKHFFCEISSESRVPELFCFDEEDSMVDVGVDTFADGVSSSAPSVVDFGDDSEIAKGGCRSGSGSKSRSQSGSQCRSQSRSGSGSGSG